MAGAWFLAMLLQGAGTEPPVPPPEPPPAAEAPPPVDNESIEDRRRPGYTDPLPDAVTQDNPGAVRAPPPEAFPADQIPVPDRWRLYRVVS